MPMEAGGSLRDHLEAAAKQGSAQARRELEPPQPLPLAAAPAWGWFGELHAARSSTGFGPAPLTYPDIAAWAALTRAAPRPLEVTWLRELDNLYLRIWHESQDKGRGKR